jgi:hypothetical protein
MRKLTTVIGLVLIVALGLVATVGRPQPARAADGDNVVLQWDEVTLQAIRDTRPLPTVAARALAVVHTVIYDAWAAYDPVAVGTRLLGGLRQPSGERTQANKEKAISFAAYAALVDLFPGQTQQEAFARKMSALSYAIDGSDTSSAATVGRTAAQAVLDFRHGDGSNQAAGYVDSCVPACYQAVNTPRHHRRPQPLAAVAAAQRHRAELRHPPLAQRDSLCAHRGLAVPPDHRPQMSVVKGKPNSDFLKQVDLQLKYSAGLTDTQKVIAQYWEDLPGTETPPGHWCVFAQWVSRRDHNTMDTDAKLFMALTNALLDASITAWDAKRTWDSVRPITAVHWLKQGQLIQAWAGPYQGIKTIRGEDWQPYQPPGFPTPPFAEYLSGHSAFSAAAAELLKDMTGSDTFGMSVTIPAGSSTVEPGAVPASPVTLSWKAFSGAADQAGISREYGGIHFNDGDFEARKAGQDVGLQAWYKAKTYFNGKAVPKT